VKDATFQQNLLQLGNASVGDPREAEVDFTSDLT